MAITMKCPACATAFDFPDELRGKRIKCKSCGEIFKVEPPAPKPVTKIAPASKSVPAVKPAPGSKSLPAVKPAPVKVKSKAVIEDDEDDRPRSKRRDAVDDEDERPRSKRRVADDEDDEPDDKAGRRKEWDEEDDRPAKKRGLHPLLIIGPALGVVAVGIVAAVLLIRGGKKDKDSADGGGAKGPGVSCTVELPEKDINQLIVADTGNMFATFRKAEAFGNTWELDQVDVTTGKSAGKFRVPELEAPKYVAMSGDGKYVMVEQEARFGNNDRALTIFNTADRAEVAKKWVPYPKKNVFDDPSLYKAEFVGNDKLVTINTKRGLDVWQLPSFEHLVQGAKVRSVGEPLASWIESGDSIKYERLVAFSPDRKQVAIWTGDAFAVVNTEDGGEHVRLSMKGLNLANAKAGPVAWRPDGKLLAMVIEHGNFGNASTILALWNPNGEGGTTVHQLYATQFDQSKGINWWGNRYIATTGARVEGVLIDSQTGKVVRQLMPPPKKVFSFSRNGRLWYAVTPELKDRPNPNGPATVVMVDSPDELIEKDSNPDAYEDIPAARGKFLRRLWMEPTGVLRTPARYDPPLAQRLVGQP